MTTTTAVKNARTIVTAGTSNTAGSTTRGTLDLRTALGGLLTIKMTNGATGPTVQATASVLVAHDNGSTPAAGSAGATWKTIYPAVGNGTGNNTIGEWSYDIPQGTMHLEVEFTGNTGQTVTVEAYFSEITSLSTA